MEEKENDCPFHKWFDAVENHCKGRRKEQDMDEALARLRKHNEEHKRAAMDDPIDWPPRDRLVREWFHRDLRCAVVLNMQGAYCGYVHVPKDHPLADATDDEVDCKVRVHGGITFRCRDLDHGSWFGFDCAHYGDYVPGLPIPTMLGDQQHRWTEEEVVAETNDLAEQFDEIGKGNA